MRGYLACFTLLSALVGCANQPKSSGDKITDFENACVADEVYRGDIYQAQACAGLADELRAGRAARQAAMVPVTPLVTQASGIQWVATTDAPGLQFTGSFDDETGMVVIKANGPIAPNDGQRFSAELLDMMREHPNITDGVLIINSPGGSVRAAAEIAEHVSQLSMAVLVPHDAECSSACVLILAAATNRKFVSPSARIGVHSAINPVAGQETTGSKATTIDMARLYTRFGTPPEIIGQMVTTPPSGVTWLSADELKAWGVKIMPAAYDQ